MNSIRQAYYIARYDLARQLQSPALVCFLLAGLCSSFLVSWQEPGKTLAMAGLSLDMHFEEGRSFALQYAFYDLYRSAWILAVFFVFNRVLMPVTMSYTVSQSLWLRLSQASPMALTLSRVLQVLFAALLLWGFSLVWMLVYAWRHGLSPADLIPASWGLTAYVLLAGALILVMWGKPNTRMPQRTAFAIVAASIPMLLYFFGNEPQIIRHSGGYFPYAVPLGLREMSLEAMRAYTGALVLGVVLMGVAVGRGGWRGR